MENLAFWMDRFPLSCGSGNFMNEVKMMVKMAVANRISQPASLIPGSVADSRDLVFLRASFCVEHRTVESRHIKQSGDAEPSKYTYDLSGKVCKVN